MDTSRAAKDAGVLAREFSPKFTAEDLVSIPYYHAYIRMMIDGKPGKGFSAGMLQECAAPITGTSAIPRPNAGVERLIASQNT